VGIGTVLADDPELTCRLQGVDHKLTRIVVDRQLSIPLESKLVRGAVDVPTWLITREKNETAKMRALESVGIKMIAVPADDVGYIDLRVAARLLAQFGLTRVLVEGGAYLAAAMLKDDLVDRLEWFTAPMLIGDDARASVKSLNIDLLAKSPRFKSTGIRIMGEDRLESFVRIG
jgi:diaminohydroxyphosphoribosylaminopyrimidine deaminase/5-amino-6-(5-phosphoribosylamino)uracil reductase